MAQVSKTKLEGVLQITPKIFRDFRGEFAETYHKKGYSENGININFIEDDISISKKNILRGIHVDSKAWKLVSCIYGKIFVAIVNCDEKSKNFGKWQGFRLFEKDKTQLLVPPKYGCSYLVLSDRAYFSYKQSEYYDPKRQSTYKWDDPRFKIKWPVKKPSLSARDKVGYYINKK